MNRQNKYKLNNLLRQWPRGTIGVQEWLNSLGVYRQLADRYVQSQWLNRIGYGAYSLIDDSVDWTGALYALQHELEFKLHLAALSALELQNAAHYIPLAQEPTIWLFKSTQEHRLLPRWLKVNFNQLRCVTRNLFKDDELGLTTIAIKGYRLKVATRERALLECFDLAPTYLSLEHIQLLMEGMTTLRPSLLQALLENCHSIKVKRLFLLFAEHAKHTWLDALEIAKIACGEGNRVIGKGGNYYSKYKISLPIKLGEHEGYNHAEE